VTKAEFLQEAKKLVDWKPQEFSAVRIDLIFTEVSDLSARWWADTVKRIILSGNPRIDIGESARANRAAKNSEMRAMAAVRIANGEGELRTDDGLQKVLKSMGANSLLDAISMKRGGQGHGS